MKRLPLSFAALALGLAASNANAHSTFAEHEVVQNQTARLTLRVPHGCGDEPTLRVRVQIPEGVISAQPMVKAGWGLETVIGTYANAHTVHGRTVTEGVREIVWTGELPAAFYDEFVFRAFVTEEVPADQKLYIPVVQECANGAERWIEIPGEGQTSDDLEGPAPGVMVLPGMSRH